MKRAASPGPEKKLAAKAATAKTKVAKSTAPVDKPRTRATKGAAAGEPAKVRTASATTPLSLLSRGGQARKGGVTLVFGSASLKVDPAQYRERLRFVEASRAALEKARFGFSGAGVSLPKRRGVPKFYADPTDPRRVVRELDGKREIGVFEDGVFKAVA